MQCEKHKYTLQRHGQDLFKASKTWLKGVKQPLKNGVLGAKSGQLDLQNYELATKLERQNGAKCRSYSSK